MSLLVTGSIGIDTVSTPFGSRDDCLGGSAVYFSMSASNFSPVRFVGAVGADCPFDLAEVFAGRDVDLSGLEVRAMSKTFRWKGSYIDAMNEAITDAVELNILAEKPPVVPAEFADSKYVFLANTAPDLQKQLLEQLDGPLFVAADTMNCWIDGRLDELKELLKKIDCLIINAEEARSLAGKSNLIKAAKAILEMGPKYIVIKKGEYGSMLTDNQGNMFILPAYPAEAVVDPTGAGDSFAGAFMGRIAEAGTLDFDLLKEAIVYGTVVSSFTISGFSLEALGAVSRDEINKRFEQMKWLVNF